MDVKESSLMVEGGDLLSHTAASHSVGHGEEALKDIICGSVAGVVGKYIEYPFDTIKVRLQSQPNTTPLRYSGPLDCFKQSLQRDGFIGIYRGISAPLVGAAVETSTLFFSVSARHSNWSRTSLTSPVSHCL